MQQIQVRPATAEDADGIAEVHRLSRATYYGLSPGPPRDSMTRCGGELVAEPSRQTYVAESTGAMLGFVSSIRLGPTDQLELTSLYVLPTHFGTGIGPVLYEEFDRELSRGQIGNLEVWAGNHRAIDFYLRRGWIPTSITRTGPQGIDYIRYELRR